VGTLLDSTVFIDLERRLRGLPPDEAMAEARRRLSRELGLQEEVGMAAITASELLQGVHRAQPRHRARREGFVEAAFEAFPSLPFDLRCARVHARLWTTLTAAGADVAAHDRIIAATALTYGWRLATGNLRHFAHMAGLEVLELGLS
jgi:tRNA(fMet)-specific endonuclease VapC